MSSPGSDALRIELRPWLLAERVAAGLVACCALVIEAVAAQYPEPRPWLGIAALVLLASWAWRRRANAAGLAGVSVGPDGQWLTLFADGTTQPSELLRGTRLLGSTVALRWRAGRNVRYAWLTPWDVSAGKLRELAVRLHAAAIREEA
jgi:MYXO-CTERM domain-containing protein